MRKKRLIWKDKLNDTKRKISIWQPGVEGLSVKIKTFGFGNRAKKVSWDKVFENLTGFTKKIHHLKEENHIDLLYKYHQATIDWLARSNHRWFETTTDLNLLFGRPSLFMTANRPFRLPNTLDNSIHQTVKQNHFKNNKPGKHVPSIKTNGTLTTYCLPTSIQSRD